MRADDGGCGTAACADYLLARLRAAGKDENVHDQYKTVITNQRAIAVGTRCSNSYYSAPPGNLNAELTGYSAVDCAVPSKVHSTVYSAEHNAVQ